MLLTKYVLQRRSGGFVTVWEALVRVSLEYQSALCGHNDQDHFTRCFLRCKNFSPNVFADSNTAKLLRSQQFHNQRDKVKHDSAARPHKPERLFQKRSVTSGDWSHYQQDGFVGAVPPAAQMTQLLWPLPLPVCNADPRDIIQMFFLLSHLHWGRLHPCCRERLSVA